MSKKINNDDIKEELDKNLNKGFSLAMAYLGSLRLLRIIEKLAIEDDEYKAQMFSIINKIDLDRFEKIVNQVIEEYLESHSHASEGE